MTDAPIDAVNIPRLSYPDLFWKFLRFGMLAWGGPVAQLALIKQELIEEEKWITPAQFNRVLAVYQVLPGPEATEMCVYFGYLSRGRLGGILAGLGFVLPGFILMMLLSWFYVTYGITSPLFAAMFFGVKPVVAALIVRAVHRIGQHALTDRWLWALAIGAGLATIFEVNFVIILLAAGFMYMLIRRVPAEHAPHVVMLALPLIPVALAVSVPSLLLMFGSGLRAGLLTFGGAYTAIPFVQRDAVEIGGWMTNAQFIDGLALSGILPAPLIIFTTFVGYLGGGPLGAVLMTLGTFLPAFSFTLIGHNLFERLIAHPRIRTFLDGVTASVIGLIAVTSAELLWAARPQTPRDAILAAAIFIASLVIIYRWKSKIAVLAAIALGGIVGLLTLL
jgi:chromate transporter